MLALELTGFLGGKYVARGVTPLFHSLEGPHRLTTAHITAGPQAGLDTFHYSSSGGCHPWVRAGIFVLICLPSVL